MNVKTESVFNNTKETISDYKPSKSRFNGGRLTGIAAKIIEKTQQTCSPIIVKVFYYMNYKEVIEAKKVDRETETKIERLRNEYLSREKLMKRINQTKEKLKSYNQGYEYMKKQGTKYVNYTMDFNGSVIPVTELSLKAHKGMVNILPKTTIKNSILMNEKQTKKELNHVMKVKEDSLFGDNTEYKVESNKLAIAKLTPSFGVTIKGNDGVKRGPSVVDDPKLKHKQIPGFTRNKSQINQLNLFNTHSKKLESTLAVQANPLPANTLLSLIPTTTINIPRRLKSGCGRNKSAVERVTVQREALDLNMAFVEEHGLTRVGTSGKTVLPKIHNSGKNTRTRTPMSTHNSKDRMIPSSLGRRIGQGTFEYKVI